MVHLAIPTMLMAALALRGTQNELSSESNKHSVRGFPASKVVSLTATAQTGSTKKILSARRSFLESSSAVLASLAIVTAFSDASEASAFDGAGASASSGYNPASKAERVKGWKKRVTADVADFNRLGASLKAGEAGESSKAWVNFFIPYQRREPDDVGRTYGALVDLRGLPTKKKYEYEGGDALLLATSFTKAGKPPENTPAVKAWNKLFKSFDAIEAAGKKGDAAKALSEWEKTKPLLEEYLAAVDLPGSLGDSSYSTIK